MGSIRMGVGTLMGNCALVDLVFSLSVARHEAGLSAGILQNHGEVCNQLIHLRAAARHWYCCHGGSFPIGVIAGQNTNGTIED